MIDKIKNLTSKEKAELYQEAKSDYINQNNIRELIKEAHKIFLIYVNYCAVNYAKSKNKDDNYANMMQDMYLSKYIFKISIDPFYAKHYKSDLNYFRRNEMLSKATEYYMIVQDSYDVHEMKKNLDLIYDMYIEDLRNDD